MNDLNKKIRRTQQYWFEDGLVELLIGLLFVVLGSLSWWQATSDSEYASLVGGIAMPFIILLGGLLMCLTLRWLKQRLVYPRTGYVTYAKPTNLQRGRSALLGMLIGGATAVALTSIETPALSTALIGIGTGVAWFILGIRFGILRFHILSVWFVAVGIMLAYWGLDQAMASAWSIGLIGLGLVASGVFAFWRYWQNSEPGNDEPMEALS